MLYMDTDAQHIKCERKHNPTKMSIKKHFGNTRTSKKKNIFVFSVVRKKHCTKYLFEATCLSYSN